MDFLKIFNTYSWEDISDKIYNKTTADVERAIYSSRNSLDDFMALVSPSATTFLEEMAQQPENKMVFLNNWNCLP